MGLEGPMWLAGYVLGTPNDDFTIEMHWKSRRKGLSGINASATVCLKKRWWAVFYDIQTGDYRVEFKEILIKPKKIALPTQAKQDIL